MNNSEFIKRFKSDYKYKIEQATARNKWSFAVLSDNILFGLSVCNISDVASQEIYFYDNVEHTYFFKVNSADALFTLLTEMNANKDKVGDIIFSIIREKNVNPDNPFYLKLYAFEGIRI